MTGPYTLTVRNVNRALSEIMWSLKISGVEEPSRNGPVLLLPAPIIVEYTQPRERVLFSAVRDANPFFHFMEALWMLAGRNDVEWIQQYNSRMGEFSDDKQTLWGAYGYRWRHFFDGIDQLEHAIRQLRANPHSRRVVLSMWSPEGDLCATFNPEDAGDNPTPLGGPTSRDLPCNTHIYLAIHNGRLNITVCNRSNDAIWGAFGTNVVHMSILQEYIASALGVEVGPYYQFSNNMHVYTEKFDERQRLVLATHPDDRYARGLVVPAPLLIADETIMDFDRDLRQFFEDDVRSAWRTVFFRSTVMPMYWAWRHRKEDLSSGIPDAKEIAAADWRTACVEWLERREAAVSA